MRESCPGMDDCCSFLDRKGEFSFLISSFLWYLLLAKWQEEKQYFAQKGNLTLPAIIYCLSVKHIFKTQNITCDWSKQDLVDLESAYLESF